MSDSQSNNKFQKWGLIVAVISLVITNALTVRGLAIQNKALNAQSGLLTQQLIATNQRAAQQAIQDHALTAGVFRDLDNHNFEIQKLLFEKPHLYAYFYNKDADPSSIKDPQDVIRVQLIAEMLLDFMEAFHNPHIEVLPGMKRGEPFRSVWENYFGDLFKTSKILCKLAKEKPDWWSNPIIKTHSETTCKNHAKESADINSRK